MKLFNGIFILLFATGAFAQSSMDEEAVKQRDAELNQLILANKSNEATDFYAEDFILTTSAGSSKSKTDMLNEISSPELKLEINLTEQVRIRMLGTTAVLTGILHQKGTYKGKAFDVFLKVTDTWVKTESGWKILAGHASLLPKS